jgi:hypothetical protein
MHTQLTPIPLQPRSSQKLIVEIAETLFDIGTDLLRKKSLDGAVRYLRWSWDYILQITKVENLAVDAAELSMNIRHNLAKALIRRGIGDESDLERARELVDGLALVGLCFRLIIGCTKGILDVSFEIGVFGETGWINGCCVC